MVPTRVATLVLEAFLILEVVLIVTLGVQVVMDLLKRVSNRVTLNIKNPVITNTNSNDSSKISLFRKLHKDTVNSLGIQILSKVLAP